MRRAALALFAFLAGATPAFAASSVEGLQVPPGFRVAVFADGVPNARQLARSPRGVVFAGSREPGKVYAMTDRDGDGRADDVRVVLDGLRLPNGVAVRGDDLYVGTLERILVVRGVDHALAAGALRPEVALDGLPANPWHGTRYLAFGPDGRLYFPIGAPCNACVPDPGFGTWNAWDLRTGRREIIARGVRSSVGIDWQPVTGDLWFSENGRDNLGDDLPADKINRLPRPGADFGFPWIHGGDLPDPALNADGARKASEFTAPAWRLPAHTAPLGIHFYRGSAFPARYRGALLVAQHGSWNRSTRVGYQVLALFLAPDGRTVRSAEPLVTGFLSRDASGERVSGRPCDLLELPDGSLLISDDHAGRVLRLWFAGPLPDKSSAN